MKLKSFGMNKIAMRFRGKRLLIVLDDVTTSRQLTALKGNPKLLGLGSVLIVTTRDVSVLNSLDHVDHLYTMQEMAENESLVGMLLDNQVQ